jgi:hypothetical protein
VDLYSVGQPVLAAILLWFTANTWLFLAAVLALRVLYEPGRFAREARSPATLTGVAGIGVLGTAFAVHGWFPVAAALLGLGGVTWALLLTPVLSHWETPVAGVSFLRPGDSSPFPGRRLDSTRPAGHRVQPVRGDRRHPGRIVRSRIRRQRGHQPTRPGLRCPGQPGPQHQRHEAHRRRRPRARHLGRRQQPDRRHRTSDLTPGTADTQRGHAVRPAAGLNPP